MKEPGVVKNKGLGLSDARGLRYLMGLRTLKRWLPVAVQELLILAVSMRIGHLST